MRFTTTLSSTRELRHNPRCCSARRELVGIGCLLSVQYSGRHRFCWPIRYSVESVSVCLWPPCYLKTASPGGNFFWYRLLFLSWLWYSFHSLLASIKHFLFIVEGCWFAIKLSWFITLVIGLFRSLRHAFSSYLQPRHTQDDLLPIYIFFLQAAQASLHIIDSRRWSSISFSYADQKGAGEVDRTFRLRSGCSVP